MNTAVDRVVRAADVDVSEADRLAGAIDQMYNDELDVIVVRRALDPARLGRAGSRHQLGVGAEMYRESIGAFREQVTPATGTSVPNRPDIPDGTGYANIGVFVNDTVVVVQGRLSVRAGLRYGHFAFSTIANPLLGVADEGVNTQAVTFNAGLLYSLTRNLHATLNAGRGFRAANAADLGSIGSQRRRGLRGHAVACSGSWRAGGQHRRGGRDLDGPAGSGAGG
jgi:hypothetical protein